MTKRTRNILFSIFVISFLIVAPLTVFYSLGWRFDFENFKIVQTGSFYFRAWPKSSEIFIDDKLKDKTDVFFGSALVDSLAPDNYKIEVRKEGYYSWYKTLEIEKREVTEIKNVTLIPQNTNFEISAEGVEEMFVSPNNGKIIVKEESSDGKWSLKLYELESGIKSQIVGETDFSSKGVDLFNLKFSSDSNRIILELGLKEKLQYYILDIKKSPAVITRLDFIDSSEEIYFHPKDNNKVFITQDVVDKRKNIITLNEVDYVGKEIFAPTFVNVVTVTITDNNIYYLDTLGSVWKSDIDGSRAEKINIMAFNYQEETDYEVISAGLDVLLRENELLYLFDEDTKSFKKIFDSLKGYRISSDNNKLAYWSNNEIKVLFLEKQYDQPIKEKGDQLFVTRFSESIGNVFWYTNYYLIFDLGKNIKVVELDDRGEINIADLTEFDQDQMLFSNKKLYLLSNKTLFTSPQLTQ